MGGFEKYWPLAGSGCLNGARGQRGEVAGSSICKQNSPTSGANGLAELPELPPAQVHMQACACPVARNPQAFRNIACTDVHWPAAFCICLLVFSPPLALEESMSPGYGQLRWLTAGSLEVEEPLKQRCHFLSHTNLQPPPKSCLTFICDKLPRNSQSLCLGIVLGGVSYFVSN